MVSNLILICVLTGYLERGVQGKQSVQGTSMRFEPGPYFRSADPNHGVVDTDPTRLVIPTRTGKLLQVRLNLEIAIGVHESPCSPPGA